MPAVSGMGIHPIKLKEPGLQTGSFNFSILLRRRRESAYEANFITCLQNMLDATPTSVTRLRNVIYESFLSRIGLLFILHHLSFIIPHSSFIILPSSFFPHFQSDHTPLPGSA
jgi:hypothetical protein